MTMHKDSMVVQTLLFDKRWTGVEVRTWLHLHNYRAQLDNKPKHWRARQIDPTCFIKSSFRTMTWAPGIQAVVGKLKH